MNQIFVLLSALFQYIICYTSFDTQTFKMVDGLRFQYIICYTSFGWTSLRTEIWKISIHLMLHFIPRKYKIPLLRDIYILTHKSAFFNTFYQPFLYFFHHNTLYLKIITYISRSPTFFIHFRLVKKNKNNPKYAHIVTAITVTLFIILTIDKIFVFSYNFSKINV